MPGSWIDAPLPPLTPGPPAIMPILLRDGGARNLLEVTDFTQRLVQPCVDALTAAADPATGRLKERGRTIAVQPGLPC